MTPDSETETLIGRFFAGAVTQSDLDKLEAILADNPHMRRHFRREANLDGALRDWAEVRGLQDAWALSSLPLFGRSAGRPTTRFSGVALVAAGIFFGLLSSSLIFAAIGPWPDYDHSVPLTELAFWPDAPPSQDGVPKKFGRWGGDFSRVLSADQGVKAPGGQMLRILRSDNSTSPAGEPTHVGELWHYIDLRPLRKRIGRESVAVALSALINSADAAEGERHVFTIGIHAFETDAPGFTALWDSVFDDGRDVLIASAARSQISDVNPSTWQKLSAEIVVPPESSVLLVYVSVARVCKPALRPEPIEFPGQYIADVSLRLRPPEPPHP